jgi:hypothetical protein
MEHPVIIRQVKQSTSIKKNNKGIKNRLVLYNQNSMAQKKPRDPITAYRKRNLKEQTRQSRKAPASANNQNLAKVIVIVFIVVILILVYMLGFFSG